MYKQTNTICKPKRIVSENGLSPVRRQAIIIWTNDGIFLTGPLWEEYPVDSLHKGPVLRGFDDAFVVNLNKFWVYIRVAGELWRHYAPVTSPALLYFQICTLVNSTMMLCPAPSIPFRAPLQDIWNSPHDTGHPISHDLINASVTFLCSSMCFPINAPFVIHYNPQFDDFPEPDRIRSFRIYYPHNHRHVEVKVGPLTSHDDVMILKRIPYYCPFVRDIHGSPVDSHPKCGSSIGISCWPVKAFEETVELWAIRVTPRAQVMSL